MMIVVSVVSVVVGIATVPDNFVVGFQCPVLYGFTFLPTCFHRLLAAAAISALFALAGLAPSSISIQTSDFP